MLLFDNSKRKGMKKMQKWRRALSRDVERKMMGSVAEDED